jgi:ADP-heptose:LPS heptosyltransferase
MNAPGVSLAGRLGVDGLTALLSFAPLLISNNTGPVHIAAALGTPVVDLYALTNPQHTPWRVANRVLSFDVPCKYCYKSICPEGHNDCLRRIAPSAVVQAALDLYRETRQGALREVLPADA